MQENFKALVVLKCLPAIAYRIEVLSDSTEAFDRGDKFADYQSLPSLQEYVLINAKKARIECFRRTDDGLWLLQFYELEDQRFELTSVEFQGKVAQVYEEVDFVV